MRPGQLKSGYLIEPQEFWSGDLYLYLIFTGFPDIGFTAVVVQEGVPEKGGRLLFYQLPVPEYAGLYLKFGDKAHAVIVLHHCLHVRIVRPFWHMPLQPSFSKLVSTLCFFAYDMNYIAIYLGLHVIVHVLHEFQGYLACCTLGFSQIHSVVN